MLLALPEQTIGGAWPCCWSRAGHASVIRPLSMYLSVLVNTVTAMYIPLKNAAPRVTKKPNMENVRSPVRKGTIDAIVHHAVSV